MSWRKGAGAILMAAGGVVIAAMLALAAIVGANFVEPGNVAENVATIAAVTLPPALGGLLLIALGRFAFGDWRKAKPLRVWGGRAAFALGLGVAAILVVLLLVSLPRGFGADNLGLLIQLAIGALAGALIAWTGRHISSHASPIAHR